MSVSAFSPQWWCWNQKDGCYGRCFYCGHITAPPWWSRGFTKTGTRPCSECGACFHSLSLLVTTAPLMWLAILVWDATAPNRSFLTIAGKWEGWECSLCRKHPHIVLLITTGRHQLFTAVSLNFKLPQSSSELKTESTSREAAVTQWTGLSAQSAVPCLFLFLYCGWRASLSRPEATPAVSVRVLFASEELSARAIETQREQPGAECSWKREKLLTPSLLKTVASEGQKSVYFLVQNQWHETSLLDPSVLSESVSLSFVSGIIFIRTSIHIFIVPVWTWRKEIWCKLQQHLCVTVATQQSSVTSETVNKCCCYICFSIKQLRR